MARFNVNGVLVDTMREVNEELGRKVAKKDVLEGKIEGVTFIDDSVYSDEMDTDANLSTELEDTEETVPAMNSTEEDTTTEDIEDDTEEEDIEEEDIEEEDIEEEDIEEEDIEEEEDTTPVEDIEDDIANDVNVPVLTLVPNIKKVPEPTGDLNDLKAKLRKVYEKKVAENPEIGKKKEKSKKEYDLSIREYPEKGSFQKVDDLKKFFSKLSDEQVDEWLDIEGIAYTHNENAGINRMRKGMALTDYHFPRTSKSSKKSKYADFSTEELVQIAIDNNVPVKDDRGDIRILRMYTIMALKEANLLD